MVDRYGRKRTLLFAILPASVGWTLLTATTIDHATGLFVWCTARFLIGLTNGAAYITTPIYISEVTSPQVRGICTVLSVMATKLGLLLVYTIGSRVSIAHLSGCGLLPLVVFGALFVFMPETPYFQLSHGRETDAYRTWCKLRPTIDQPTVEQEIAEMRETIVDQLPSQRAILMQLWRVPSNRNGLHMMLVYGAMIALCGSQTVNSYAQIVFDSANSAILMASVQLIAATVSSLLADTVGRRPLVLGSIGGTTVCNAIVGVCFVLQHRSGMPAEWSATVSWIQLGAIVTFFACFVLGLSAMFGVLFAELFPTNVRCMAAALVATHGSLWVAAVGKVFQVVSERVGNEWMWASFAGCGAAALVYMWCVLPETKGRSLQRIQVERRLRMGNDGVNEATV